MGKQGKTIRRVRERLAAQQGGKCYWCGDELILGKGPADGAQHPRQATLDHIIPTSLGGPKGPTLGNVVVACQDCNTRRGNESARAFSLRQAGQFA